MKRKTDEYVFGQRRGPSKAIWWLNGVLAIVCVLFLFYIAIGGDNSPLNLDGVFAALDRFLAPK